MSLTKAVARGVGYPLLVVVGVLFLPVTIGVAVATNYRDTAERLSGIPGIDPEGSVLSGALLGGVLALVAASAIAGAGFLASGTFPEEVGGGATPTETPAPATETPTATPAATEIQTVEPNDIYTTFSFCNRFEDNLRDATEFEVQSVTTDGTNCKLVYIQRPPLTTSEVSDNVSSISGGYLAAVNHTEGGHPEKLEVGVRDSSEETIYTFYIETQWARDELSGELSTKEYLREVHETIDIKERN